MKFGFALVFFAGFLSALLGLKFDKSPFVERYLRAIIQKCQSYSDKGESFGCFRNGSKKFVAQNGIGQAILALEKVSQNFSEQVSCHDLAHILGEVAIETGESLAKTISACSRKCGYGCVHGAVMGEIKKDPEFINNLDPVCQELALSEFPIQDITACKHGLGHGLAEYAGFDIIKSLSFCDGLKDLGGREECGTGVFMEIFDSPTFSHPKFVFPEDIISFCKSLPDVYSNVCLRNAGNYEFRRSRDLSKAFNTCRGLANELYRDCSVSLGADFHFTFAGSEVNIWNACRFGNDQEFASCIDGAIYSSLVSDSTGEHSTKLCRLGGKEESRICFGFLGETIEEVRNSQEREKFCAKLGLVEKESCFGN